jgi:LuxR family maltose regulon positive regulatory protein
MQQVPLLQTKLYIPPNRPELVSRPRLIERLDAGLRQNQGFGSKLTLVSAPAGFGKTTLVGEWVNRLRSETTNQDRPCCDAAWLSLDHDDNDPARFLAYLIAALRTIEPNVGKGALSALQSPQPPPADTVVTALINEIASLPKGLVVILDDYHLIEQQAIHDILTFLLSHLPPRMHLVIATREDPPLMLARLRAQGQLAELRAADLRFSSAEAAGFLNQSMGLNLSAKDISSLETRTEGWIAGLQLAAISMQRRQDTSEVIGTFTGSHRYVMDYLVQEVLEQQTENIKAFLLQTAILDRLTGALCDAVTGQHTGQATLEFLERANLFVVPLDDERQWYRYHHLFADLLRRRLDRSQPGRGLELHRQASEWYERQGFADEAMEHALSAEDFERAARLVEGHADTIWQSGEHTKLWRWLEGLPAEWVSSRPHLSVFHARSLYARGQPDAAEQALQAAEQALSPGTDLTTGTGPAGPALSHQPDRKKLLGRIAVTHALLAFFRGDLSAIVKYSHQALEYLPEQDSAWRSTAAIAQGDAYRIEGNIKAAHQARYRALEISQAADNIYMILTASMKLAVTMRQMGQLERAGEVCEQQVQLANENGLSQSAIAGGFLAIGGEVQAEFGDLASAVDEAKRGVALAESGEDTVVLGWSYLCLARVLLTAGDWGGAQELIRRVETKTRQSDIPPWIARMMAGWQARLWLSQDRMEAASRWMAERESDAGGVLPFLREFEDIVEARILIAQGRLDDAVTLLQRLLEEAETGDRISSVIEILILQSLALEAQGQSERAMNSLQKALMAAEPGGFVHTFVDEGPAMAQLLYKAAMSGISPRYARRLLSAFPMAEQEHTVPPETQVIQTGLVEPLSEREMEVLQLIADGLTNPEIASRLFLAINTVKSHTRNIYGKLDVHNRTQAVARARVLGVLPSI